MQLSIFCVNGNTLPSTPLTALGLIIFQKQRTTVRTSKNDIILDRDGKPLHCNTHRFRATLATNLLNSGYDVETTGKLLGQKCLKSLGYYANVTNEKAKEQLKGRLEKDDLLISNIGKID